MNDSQRKIDAEAARLAHAAAEKMLSGGRVERHLDRVNIITIIAESFRKGAEYGRSLP